MGVPQLVPVESNPPAVVVTGPGAVLKMFERLATDPNASVEKVERMMALFERTELKRSEDSFNAAMAAAQKLMRPISADAENPQTKSRYASYSQLDRALRPIYTDQGFALSFNTGEALKPDDVRVLCYATHDAGFTREYHIDMPADGKGARGGDVMTRTHATGSAVTYGMRYLLKMIFNVAVGADDDDGNRGGGLGPKPQAPTSKPVDYDKWLLGLQGVAARGTAILMEGMNRGSKEQRAYLVRDDKQTWESLKATADQAGKAGAE